MLSSSSNGQGRPLFDVVYPAFALPTTASPDVLGALKNGFGETAVPRDMPKLFQFPSRDGKSHEFTIYYIPCRNGG